MPVVWRGNIVNAQVQAAAMRGLIDGGFIVKGEMIRRIQSPPKSGMVYTRRGVRHQASAPGEAPATDLGNLINSITDPIPNMALLTVTINVGARYAAALEYGTRKMEPRPYARSSMLAMFPVVQQRVAAAIRKAL